MPKFATLALKAAMKALKPQMGKIDLEHQRAMQDKAVPCRSRKLQAEAAAIAGQADGKGL